jgi:hypothetical protein
MLNTAHNNSKPEKRRKTIPHIFHLNDGIMTNKKMIAEN